MNDRWGNAGWGVAGGGLTPAAGSPRQGRLISVSDRASVNKNGARPFCGEEGGNRDLGH